jgi:hypothetical protein
MAGGNIRSVERASSRTRYTVSALDPAQAIQATPQLKAAIKEFAPFQDVYIDWVRDDSPAPVPQLDDYPFAIELDASSLPRHKMNLIFATCAWADALIEKGYTAEAKKLLSEALMVEPRAGIVVERLNALP